MRMRMTMRMEMRMCPLSLPRETLRLPQLSLLLSPWDARVFCIFLWGRFGCCPFVCIFGVKQWLWFGG